MQKMEKRFDYRVVLSLSHQFTVEADNEADAKAKAEQQADNLDKETVWYLYQKASEIETLDLMDTVDKSEAMGLCPLPD